MFKGMSVLVAVLVLPACDEQKETAASGIAAIASGSLAVKNASAAPAPAPVEPANVVRRPGLDEELLVTDGIRARVENRHPEAAGFLTGKEIEEKLFAMDLKRGKDDVALQRLDSIAKGKWVLLTGPVTGSKPEGFELPIRYTPRDANDPMGLTSQWLNIELTQLEGWDAAEYRSGEKTAVLVKYNGDKKASPGFDLVLLDQWYE